MEPADTTIHANASAHASGANSCSAAKVHTVAVTGSTGLVGKALCEELRKEGYHVIRLLREGARGLDDRTWNPTNPNPGILNGVDALIHLAGESTEGIWTQDKKRRIRDSRVIPTRKLAELVAQSETVHTFICASAISIYQAIVAALKSSPKSLPQVMGSSPTSSKSGKAPASRPAPPGSASSTCAPALCCPVTAVCCHSSSISSTGAAVASLGWGSGGCPGSTLMTSSASTPLCSPATKSRDPSMPLAQSPVPTRTSPRRWA